MPRIRLMRRRLALLLFPCALLVLPLPGDVRSFNSEHLDLALNPLARAQANAQMQSCQGALNQIGTAMMLYAHDYDNKLPLNTTPTQNWDALIFPYTGSIEILHCPSDVPYLGSDHMIPSYWMNADLLNARGEGRRLSMREPWRVFLVGEGSVATAKSPFILSQQQWNGSARYANRHLFGANYLFADGHVKWLSSNTVRAIGSQSSRTTRYCWQAN